VEDGGEAAIDALSVVVRLRVRALGREGGAEKALRLLLEEREQPPGVGNPLELVHAAVGKAEP
jgi:hypothetical protein